MKPHFASRAALALLLLGSPAAAGVHFVGQIMDNGNPVTGVHHFTFTLVSSAPNFRALAAPCEVDLPCIGGQFAAELPFAPNEWAGVDGVRINFDGTDLGPAMPAGDVPAAYFANTATVAESASVLINPPPQTGVAFTNHDPRLALSIGTGVTQLMSITVNAPAAGYVHAEATGDLVSIGANCAWFRLATSAPPAGFDGIGQCVDGTTESFSLSQIFTVASAGSHTFRIYGRRGTTSSPVTARISQIQAVWIPTSIAP